MDAQKPPASLLRELEQLRQENARLSRLLELRGDTVPADEQPAIPVHQPGMVTHDSPTADKLALYTDLFRARRDVYALRWENHRTGRQGWSPAIAGGWARLVDKKRARHLPLTNDVLVAHLTGDVFVGLYPLLPGGECHWLAADFDGPTAMLDALAYTKAGRSRGIAAALELSQSGRGAHVGSSSRVRSRQQLPELWARGSFMRRCCCAGRWTCDHMTVCSRIRTSYLRVASAT